MIAFEPSGCQSLEICYSLHPLAIGLGTLLIERFVDSIWPRNLTDLPALWVPWTTTICRLKHWIFKSRDVDLVAANCLPGITRCFFHLNQLFFIHQALPEPEAPYEQRSGRLHVSRIIINSQCLMFLAVSFLEGHQYSSPSLQPTIDLVAKAQGDCTSGFRHGRKP